MKSIDYIAIIGIVIALPIGGVIGYISRKRSAEKTIVSAEIRSQEIVSEATKQAETAKKEKNYRSQRRSS